MITVEQMKQNYDDYKLEGLYVVYPALQEGTLTSNKGIEVYDQVGNILHESATSVEIITAGTGYLYARITLPLLGVSFKE